MMTRPSRRRSISLVASILACACWPAPGYGGESVPPHDPRLLTRLVSAKHVTAQRISGPQLEDCRPDFTVDSDTIECYPAASVFMAPSGKWRRELLDLVAQWGWLRGRQGIGPVFEPALGIHFRGDSLDVDWLLSLEPLSAMIRVQGIPSATVTISKEDHWALLSLMHQAFPKDSQIAARYAAVQRPVYPGCDCWVEVPFKAPYKKIAAPQDTSGCYAESPVAIKRDPPIYPEFAKEAQIQGEVVLHALVGSGGEVVQVKLATRVVGLDDSAVHAVRKWIFEPARKGGEPVCTWIEIPLEFRLP